MWLALLAWVAAPEVPADSGDWCPVDSVPVDLDDSAPPEETGDSAAEAPLWPGDPCDPLDDRCGYHTVCCTECCRADATPVCTPPAEDGLCPLPDLTVLPERISGSWYTTVESFAADSCALVEGCVAAPGTRRLLRFDTTTPNYGTADLYFGNPSGNPLFHYSECHQHMHFDGYARYRLLNPDGTEAATGHKQAFCLMDIERLSDDAAEVNQYDCGHQGIQRGWADTYGADLDCQWIDITDVAPGTYTIEVRLNPDRLIPENHYEDNVVRVTIQLEEQSVPTDACAKGEDGPGRECGWAVAANLACTPGEMVTVGARAAATGPASGTRCSGSARGWTTPASRATPWPTSTTPRSAGTAPGPSSPARRRRRSPC